ncbi:hypothetical protein WIS52_20630 [Pseudonocardia nematodicida]|uniref:Uncharacterized protein n=1 Tax=Pseudonocardia nematodicida TaxID=1206997 RepID=A0ABV1KEI5_9PSEU
MAVGIVQFAMARRRWPNPLVALRISDSDRVRTAVARPVTVAELPERLRLVAVLFAEHVIYVRSRCAPWFAAGLGSLLGMNIVQAFLEPGLSAALNLAFVAVLATLNAWPYLRSWSRAQQVTRCVPRRS